VSFECREPDVFRWIFGTGTGRSRLPGSRSLHRRGAGKRIAPVCAAGERLVRSGWGHISGVSTPKAIRTHKHLLRWSHLSDGSARQQYKAGPIAHSLRAAAAGREPLLQRTSAACGRSCRVRWTREVSGRAAIFPLGRRLRKGQRLLCRFLGGQVPGRQTARRALQRHRLSLLWATANFCTMN
jgi:hypothetical protein